MMKIHPVFHVSLLERYKSSNDTSELPPPVLQDDVEKYKIEQVRDSKFTRRKLRYKVAWADYPAAYNEWVDASAMGNATNFVEEFH